MQRRPPLRRRLPRQIPPNAIIIAYRAALLAMLKDARELVRRLFLPKLPGLLEEAKRERGDSLRMDAAGKRAKELAQQLRLSFMDAHPARELEALADRVGRRISSHQKEQLQRQLRAAVGVDVVAAEPNLAGPIDNFVQENVSLITSIPMRYFDEVEQRTQAAIRTGTRHEDLAEELGERFGVAESRAELIARDQTLSFYARLNETRQKAVGLDGYIWRTAKDERVRPYHAEREGERFSWDDPPEGGHAGTEVNCRCWAEPDVEALIESL
jgi:SPP1 gp7 family putative phage head morphogenesis protein